MGAPARVAVIVALILCACAGGSVDLSATDSDATTTTSSTSTDGVPSTSMSTSTSSTTSTSTSTTSTTSPDETSSTEPETTTTGQICPTPAAYECDLWAQDCCEGEKCASTGGFRQWTRCVPVVREPDGVDEPCSVDAEGIDTCEKGAMCWDVDAETKTGHCVALCQGIEALCVEDPVRCCPAGTLCNIAARGTYILCLPMCDPLAQDCDGNEACYPVGVGFQCAPDVSDAMGAVGDPCEYVNVCDPGTYCGDPEIYPGCDVNAPGCCIPFCPLDTPACAPGTECLPWYEPMDAPPGYGNVGACTIPP